jgi:uridine kinase
MTGPLLVGIAGGTGAGKTTVARRLMDRYASVGIALVDQDAYYRDRSALLAVARAALNYDEPAAIDHDLLAQHVRQLAAGQPIPKPRYSFVTHTRSADTDRVTSAPLVVVEGIFAFWDARVRAALGLKVYVHAEPDIRFIRRLERDVTERGRTAESVIAQYIRFVRPMHVAHVEPMRDHADLILAGDDLEREIDRLADVIDVHLGMRVVDG